MGVVMTKEQIEYMRDRFLQWKLPANFRPDGGINFVPVGNKGTRYEAKNEPVGTNLLDATQAEEMIRFMLDGLPDATPFDEHPKIKFEPIPNDELDAMTLLGIRERWKWERDVLAPVKAQCDRYQDLAWKWMEKADQLMDEVVRIKGLK